MKTVIISVIIIFLLSLYVEGYIKAEKWDLSEEHRKKFRELYFPSITPKGLQAILDRFLVALTLLVIYLSYKGLI